MAIELHLQKTTKTPWGFRLAGGVEYEVPLTVIKVVEGTIAENAGMQIGDVVVRVNDIPMAALTHPQAHDVLVSAGDDFVIAVRRGDLSHLPPRLLLYDTDVENPDGTEAEAAEVYRIEEENDQDLNITDEEIVNIIGEKVQVDTQKTTETTTVEISEETKETRTQSEVSKVVLSEESQKTEEKKWSTFLQKPNNPKPEPKAKEPEAPKAPPYKVIIKKQPKKGQEIAKDNSKKVEETVESDTSLLNIEENKENVELEQIQPEEELPKDTQIEDQLDENENYTAKGREPIETDEMEEKCETEDEQQEDIKENTEEIEDTSAANEKRLSINLEEQLAQVQQQLLALSQLPSAIQQTLNAVTQQLSEIVSAKNLQEQEVSIEAKATIEEETMEEYLEISEREEKALSVLEEESIEHYEEELRPEESREETVENIINESEDEQALFEQFEKEIEEEERRKQEELEAERIEQEKTEKKEKERRPSQPLTPLQRPIILPGGRKWSQPDDAISKTRRPSMTDEKIANTINTFSEVIVGRTVGINFLKYQAPPKNLDYLQKSAVYRLVHDIEPPVRGIVARDTKILAEQDYYTEKQESKDLPAQMER